MKVRALVKEDLPALLELYRHLNPFDAPLPHQQVVDSVWAESLVNPRMRHFGGFDSASLVAACTICAVPNLTRGCRPYALNENVVTASTHRRRGWGRAVLAEASAFAWSQDCYKVMLLTGRQDEGVLSFYKASGFTPDEKKGFVARPARR